MQPLQKLEPGLEIKTRLLPRFEAWCKYKGYTIKLIANEMASSNSKSSLSFLQKVINPLKQLCSKSSSDHSTSSSAHSTQDKTLTKEEIISRSWNWKIENRTIHLPWDVVKLILNSSFEVQGKWRTINKVYRDFIDTQTPYWLNQEREMIAKEFPKALLNSFQGVDNIHRLAVLPSSIRRDGEMHVTPEKNLENMRLLGCIRGLKPSYLTNSFMRGIDSNGRHMVVFVVYNQSTRRMITLTMHESVPAFLSAREKEKMGWVASYDAKDTYQTPWADEICSFANHEEILASPHFVTEMRQLVSGETLQKEVGDASLRVTCDFKKGLPN